MLPASSEINRTLPPAGKISHCSCINLSCYLAISFLVCVSAELSDPGDVSGSGGSGD